MAAVDGPGPGYARRMALDPAPSFWERKCAERALLERFAELVSTRRAELASLGREELQQHTNSLVEAMRSLFSVLGGGAGGEAADRRS